MVRNCRACRVPIISMELPPCGQVDATIGRAPEEEVPGRGVCICSTQRIATCGPLLPHFGRAIYSQTFPMERKHGGAAQLLNKKVADARRD